MKNVTISFLDTNELHLIQENKDVIDTNKTLIQVFCANEDKIFINNIQKFFQENFPKSILIGTTTDGIIDSHVVYNETKSVVTFTMFKSTTLKSKILKHIDYDFNSFDIGEMIAKEIVTDKTKVMISFADGIKTNGEEYLNGISNISSDVIVSGGLSADNGRLAQTYVFDKFELVDYGVVAVSLENKNLSVMNSYTFDWMPIGKKLRVTKSVKNRVYEIDSIPAVDVYAKYLSKELAESLPQIGIEFPLIFQKDDVSVGRAVLHKHNDGSLTFAGNIEEGTEVSFGIGNVELILRNSHYNVELMAKQTKYKPEAIFIYSCMARRRFMNEHILDELKTLNRLGDISGFFTYGEFFHSSGLNQLLNETMTMLALSENEENYIRIEDDVKVYDKEFNLNTSHVLAHLANKVSNELEDLNMNLEQRIQDTSKHIYRQAYFNELTGLKNRISLIKTLDESIGQIVFLINIDDFTIINDFYGHEVGDKVLIRVAELLQESVKDNKAEVFKLPSDEYAIIIDIKHKKSIIEEKIKHIINDIRNEELLFQGHKMFLSITVAAAFINKKRTGLTNADMTLKLAKKASKRFMIFNDDLKLASQYEHNLNIANIIKHAIENDEIVPYFQPIIDIKTDSIYKYESLVRIKNVDEVLGPYQFLELSKKIKLYSEITKVMVEKSFSYFAKNGLNFSINLDFSDILDLDMKDYIFQKIDEYSIANQLTIEILETQEMESEKAVIEFTKEVYAHGVKIAIDDFGSGFANFQHMTIIKSDYMKIDGSLIKNIHVDEKSRLIVETIIIFAKKLNKKIIAEYVWNKEVYDVLKELGVDYVQGYYFSEPRASV